MVANLAALGFYKYINFAIEIFDTVWPHPLQPLSVTLPLGISFFTFTQIAYLSDVTLGRTNERNFIKYVLFVTYFPHLIAGPIMHHREMMPQFAAAKPRLKPDRLAIGLTIFAIGLFKKAVIADYLATIVNPVFAAAAKGAISTLDAWGGTLAYSLQIYFDFSGYCDMAIGMSFLFGIVLPFNFDAPYKSRSIAEFWHRWHITLSRFLRDYLYIPLGGNRRGEARRNYNLAVTMLVGGLWHGAGWTFIVWGGLHGLFLIVNHGWLKLKERQPALARASKTPAYAGISLALTQLCVAVAWVFFRADLLATAHRVIAAMCGLAAAPPAPAILPPPPVSALSPPLTLGACRAQRERGVPLQQCRPRYLPIAATVEPAASALDHERALGGRRGDTLTAAVVAILAVGNGTPFLYFQF